jgi:CMP-N-acetylneuraminic acid synthetase
MPLIGWTIKAAQASGVFDDLIVSTDCEDVLRVARTLGCDVLPRPVELARPDSDSLPVVLHALKMLPNRDVVTLLQPTSPFRSIDDILLSHSLLDVADADAVVSVTDTPPDTAFEIGHANRLRPKANTVVPNGSIYIATVKHLQAGGTWYEGAVYAYRMPKERSIDIDTMRDLVAAEKLVEGMRILW